jgi:serine/threonine-protein kinase
MAVCAVVLGWLAFRVERGAAQDVVRLVVSLPRDQQLAIANEASLAIAPDGRRVVYAAASPPGSRPRLFLRDLKRFEAQPIAGTEGAIGPFFSPDGRWLGYFLEGKLYRISVEGGTPIEVCHVGQVVPGACWTEDDTILYTDSPDSGLLRVPASGGTPQRLTIPAAAEGEIGHGWPSPLPDGRSIVFTVTSDEGATVAVLSLDSGEWRLLEPGLGGARYAPSGHLIFARHEGLMAVPFDPVTLRTQGTPVVVHDDVYTIPALTGFGMSAFDVSRSGALVYLPGGSAAGENRLVWVDRDGRSRPASGDPGLYEWPRLSPDGKRLAVNDAEYDGTGTIWILDLERDARSKLTRTDNNLLPAWTPDGKRLAFGSLQRGSDVVNVFWKAADASDEKTRLLESLHPRFPRSFSPDGRWLAIVEWNPDTMRDVWMLDLQGSGEARPFVDTPADEHSPYFSPDGRWLAYVSDESGRCEVYVESYPRGRGRWIISAGGGKEPVWSADGGELFYRNVDAMMAVSIESEPAFRASAPRVLFERPMKSGVYDTVSYDVAIDGSEFLMIERNLELAPQQIHVVLHWDRELRRRLPAGRD